MRRNKQSIVTYFLSLMIMGLATIVALLAVSLLTYSLKWQAAQAMVGITLTYILSGLIGGIFQGSMDGRLELRGRIVQGLLLGSGFMFILLMLSMAIVKDSNWDLMRLLMIWIVLVCSSVLGEILSNIFCKKR